MNGSEISTLMREAFAQDLSSAPKVTLRGGNALDDYREPAPFDATLDAVTDSYLEQFTWGIAYLDAQSWRHYLPYLIEYALRHIREANTVTDAMLNSLRPPDREPPRLASLSKVQEELVTRALDELAFFNDSAHKDFACQVLEEWWIPGAIYRPAIS